MWFSKAKVKSKFLKLNVLEIGGMIEEANVIRVRKDNIILYKPVTVHMLNAHRTRLFERYYHEKKSEKLQSKNPDHPAFSHLSDDPDMQMAAAGIVDVEDYQIPDFSQLTPKEEEHIKQLATAATNDQIPTGLSTSNIILVKGTQGPETIESYFTTDKIEKIDAQML